VGRRVAELAGPTTPHEVEVTADPATGHDHRLSHEMEVADLRLHRRNAARHVGWGQNRARDEDPTCADLERRHLVPVPNAHSS
jgi:hypothetical protein